jgi:hypothetical protein
MKTKNSDKAAFDAAFRAFLNRETCDLNLEYNSYLTDAVLEAALNTPDFANDFLPLMGFSVRGTALTSLPGFLQYAAGLERLDISETAIAELPPFVFELQDLHYLNIDNTAINAGDLPRWFAWKTGLDTSPEAAEAYWAWQSDTCKKMLQARPYNRLGLSKIDDQ